MAQRAFGSKSIGANRSSSPHPVPAPKRPLVLQTAFFKATKTSSVPHCLTQPSNQPPSSPSQLGRRRRRFRPSSSTAGRLTDPNWRPTSTKLIRRCNFISGAPTTVLWHRRWRTSDNSSVTSTTQQRCSTHSCRKAAAR